MSVAYPREKIRTEAAFIAYHFHWSLDLILELPHRERTEWVGHISRINQSILDSQS